MAPKINCKAKNDANETHAKALNLCYNLKDVNGGIELLKSLNCPTEQQLIDLSQMLLMQNTVDSIKEAAAILLELSQKGNISAMGFLARLYTDGRGVKRDLDKAAYYSKLAASKYPTARIDLIKILEQIGTPDSLEDAKIQFQILTELDNVSTDVFLFLARSYRYGLHTSKNLQKSLYYYRKTCFPNSSIACEYSDLLWAMGPVYHGEMYNLLKKYEKDSLDARLRLGRSYRYGAGVTLNMNTARLYYHESLDKSNVYDWAKCDYVFSILDDPTVIDKSEVLPILKTINSVFAKQILAKLYYKGNDGIKQDIFAAIELLKNETDEKSRLMLADIYSLSEKKVDRQKALSICSEIAEKGSKGAQYRLDLWELEKRLDGVKYKKSSRINIMMVSSDEYCKYTAVLMKSIEVNNPEREIHYYLVTSGITQNSKELLERVISSKNMLHVINMSDETLSKLQILTTGVHGSRWIKTVMCKVIPNIALPSDVDKALFLGSDTIVTSSLDSLYDIDLGDNYLASAGTASTYDCLYARTHKVSRLPVNGCVILYNVKKFREDNITVDSYEELIPTCSNEEPMLSERFKGHVLYLDTYRYNYRFDSVIHGLKSFDLVEPDPVIIHYVAYQKPWFFFMETDDEFYQYSKQLRISYEINNAYRVWWKYAKLCEHYHDLLTNMKLERATLFVLGESYLKELQAFDGYFEMMKSKRSMDLQKLSEYDAILVANDLIPYQRVLRSMGIYAKPYNDNEKGNVCVICTNNSNVNSKYDQFLVTDIFRK